jgi:hypothetical protein
MVKLSGSGAEGSEAYRSAHRRLRRRWRDTSLATGWTRPQDWWIPEVDAMAAAVLENCPDAAVADLGRARAEAGVGLSEALDDLYSLYRVLPCGKPPPDVLRRLAEAWVAAGMDPYRATTCEDPLSGLTSPAYLRTRLAEVYRDAERSATAAPDTHALLVVRTQPPAGSAAQRGWDWMTYRLTLGDVVRSAFPGGETFTALSASTTVGLVLRDPATLPPMLRGLDHQLRRYRTTRNARIWLERLPSGVGYAYQLLCDLER